MGAISVKRKCDEHWIIIVETTAYYGLHLLPSMFHFNLVETVGQDSVAASRKLTGEVPNQKWNINIILFLTLPISVAAWVCNLSHAGIAGSIPAGP